MKFKIALLTLFVVIGLNTTAEAVDSYKIDPDHTYVGFSIQHLVISTVKGRFNEVKGKINYDAKNLEKPAWFNNSQFWVTLSRVILQPIIG